MSRIGLFELYWPVKRDVRLSCLVYVILKTIRPWDQSVEPKGALEQALKMDCAILAGLMQIRDLREGRPTKEGLVQVHSNGYPKKYPGKFNSCECWCACWWIIYVSMYLFDAWWVGKLEIHEVQGLNFCLKASRLKAEAWLVLWFASKDRKKADVPVLRESGKKNQSSFTQRRISLRVPFRLSTDWMRPTHIRESNVLYSLYQFKC